MSTIMVLLRANFVTHVVFLRANLCLQPLVKKGQQNRQLSNYFQPENWINLGNHIKPPVIIDDPL